MLCAKKSEIIQSIYAIFWKKVNRLVSGKKRDRKRSAVEETGVNGGGTGVIEDKANNF